MNKPVVLLPCHNSHDALIKSLESLKGGDVDICIIDDGSKVALKAKELENCISHNQKLHVQRFDVNIGITKALNYGLKFLSGKGYKHLFRLDAGDIFLKQKIKKQLGYMNDNNLVLCGTYVEFIDEQGNHLYNFTPPTNHKDLCKALKQYNPFIHPSVLFDLDKILELGGYPDNYPALEDWALFLEVSKKYKVGILPEVLLKYEVSSTSISTTRRREQAKSKVKLLWDNFEPNLHSIVGLARNIAICYLPRNLLTLLKSKIYK
ncbi:glycosyltransferase [Salinisphaera sp. G21_0]|uniref:glycosyltransferase n=1 Tax=Salinisphaera sp. G21_0 TaxID=2821094 RepID=UPI001ADC51C8|nr:glycosyltransferase [Salinisphaera sp. G21_0]MBO9483086.1 glycosyltransferase [Salinisphaera sp. G21_0]